MKRIVIAFVMLMASTPVAAAPFVSFGVKGGIYTSNTTEVPTGWPETAFRNGFAGGVYMDYAFNRSFSLQPEILYVTKGLDGGLERTGYDLNYTARFDYIQVPILAKFTIAGKSRFSPYFFAGPDVGINIGADMDLEFTDTRTGESASGSSDWSDVMNTMEVCFSFGLGCRYAIGLGGITADARFDFGLTNVYSGGEVTTEFEGSSFTETVNPGNSKNLGFALLVGYNF
jgi:hypothetical protein